MKQLTETQQIILRNLDKLEAVEAFCRLVRSSSTEASTKIKTTDTVVPIKKAVHKQTQTFKKVPSLDVEAFIDAVKASSQKYERTTYYDHLARKAAMCVKLGEAFTTRGTNSEANVMGQMARSLGYTRRRVPSKKIVISTV